MYEARARTAPSAETGWIKEAPSNEEAIEYVTMKQVERGHWSNEAKEYYYAKRAAALGVRNREDSLKQNSTDVSNDTTVPSQEDHADALGVSRPTIARWEKDRKEIAEDPELAATATTLEGYKEAKKVVRDRRETVERKGLLYALAPLK
ncbi:helix-turn-helix domain-containing protein [Planktomarina temperata]|nr:helix-turn-helix domain-containing protein [Planktomarina temperata]